MDYTFTSMQLVSWLDPVNGMKGYGRWKIEKGRLIISWIGSKSWDVWDWNGEQAKKSTTTAT